MTDRICSCSQEIRSTYGYRDFDGLRKCNNCQGKFEDFTAEEIDKPAEQTAFDPASLDITSQEEIIIRLIGQLAQSGKYHSALSKGKFAAFSIMGTNDWEDYASTALRTVMLKEVLRIDKNLEDIKKILAKIEKKL